MIAASAGARVRATLADADPDATDLVTELMAATAHLPPEDNPFVSEE